MTPPEVDLLKVQVQAVFVAKVNGKAKEFVSQVFLLDADEWDSFDPAAYVAGGQASLATQLAEIEAEPNRREPAKKAAPKAPLRSA